jgi:hypothetical protein
MSQSTGRLTHDTEMRSWLAQMVDYLVESEAQIVHLFLFFQLTQPLRTLLTTAYTSISHILINTFPLNDAIIFTDNTTAIHVASKANSNLIIQQRQILQPHIDLIRNNGQKIQFLATAKRQGTNMLTCLQKKQLTYQITIFALLLTSEN